MEPPKVAKVLDYQARQITYNVYSYYKTRKLDKSTIEHKDDVNLIDLVANVTSLSKSTVTRIIKEGNAMKIADGSVSFKPRTEKHVRKKRIEVDECTEGIIRRKVIQFYTVQNEVPSVRKLNMALKKENILSCSNEYLRQLLHKLGFTNADCDSTGMMMERPDIALDRLKYLQGIRIFRKSNRSIFYMSETIFWSMRYGKDSDKPALPRIIFVHSSGEKGFSDGQILKLMPPKPKNSEPKPAVDHFEEYHWIKDSVLPNIPPKSVIIMDAPYCEVTDPSRPEAAPPAASATRVDMQDWLKKYNIPFKETAGKSALHQIIKKQTEKTKLSFSYLFINQGHNIIHLPQKHMDLNPTKMVWDSVKDNSKKTAPMTLFNKYPKKKWEACFETVTANEEEYYEHDMRMDEAVDSLKITIKEEKQDVEAEVEDEGYVLEDGNATDESMECE